MNKLTLVDELSAGYHNKLADLELGKNLESHYVDVSECIHLINNLVDTGKLISEEIEAFSKLGYHYYRLKDKLLEALILKKQREHDTNYES